MHSDSFAERALGDYTSFTDESDITARYMIIGGITCGAAFVPELFSILTRYQERMPYNGRLQWKDITKRNYQVFQDLLDEFFYLNGEHLVDFHALVVDMWNFDHTTYNEGDKEVSFDKMLFQCLLAIHKRYPGCTKIRCFHGNRDSPYPIGALGAMLNAKVYTLKYRRVYLPYAHVKNLEVKRSLPMQLADLLIGALGAHWNARKGLMPGSPKDMVAQHFKRECPVGNLLESSPRSMQHFVIWPFQVKGPAGLGG